MTHLMILICSNRLERFSPRMPPKSRGWDTPSPAKKRKTETTPVKRGVDFFFKKQVEKNALPKSPSSNRDAATAFFVKSEGEEDEDEEEWEMKKRRQEEEDEKFARELQEVEGQREVDDEEFARRLASD